MINKKTFIKVPVFILIISLVVCLFGVCAFAAETTTSSKFVESPRLITLEPGSDIFTTTSNTSSRNYTSQKDTQETATLPAPSGAYPITVISSVDTKSGTVYLSNSRIKIYSVQEGERIKDGSTPAYSTVTNKDGKAVIRLSPGYYAIAEEDYTSGNTTYVAETMYVQVKANSPDMSVYLKHTVKGEDKPLPFTGSSNAIAAVIALVLATGAAGVAVISKKKVVIDN